MAGDFNLVLDPDIDTKNYVNVNNPKAREELLNMITECNLLDTWRELNLETFKYTWRKKNTNKQARLDFFLISDCLVMDVTDAKILPGYKTDHSLISIEFKFGKFSPGKSYWKFNNSVLKDYRYVQEIKTVIEINRTRYAIIEEGNADTINEIPETNLQLSIDEPLFFDTLLMEIRGKTISYSSYKKKQENTKEQDLIKEIGKLENEANINHEILENKRSELYELGCKKWKESKYGQELDGLVREKKLLNIFVILKKEILSVKV